MMAGLTCILVLFITICHGLGETRVVNGPATRTDITLASTSNNICTDCLQIVELFKDMLSHEDTQDHIYVTLKIFCGRLPGYDKINMCESLLQEQLPKAYKYLTNMVAGDACMGLGMCALQAMTGVSVMLPDKDDSSLMPEASASLQVQIGPQCTFCVLLIKKLENMLPKERTEDAVVQLMGEVCDLLPASYKDQCDSFVDKYGKKLIDFLLSSAAPHSICVLLHLCLIKEAPVPEMPLPSDCESCRTLAALGRLRLSVNASASHTSSFLRSVCLQHPGAIPKCEVFTRLHWSSLQKVLGSQKNECQRMGLCESVGPERPFGEDSCSWGPTYRCRDMKTAEQCGSVTFCQTFIWK
ncbi:surfactant protein Bb [Hypomesus transpacificus]|uniref:surfactant protein Bb n=1 Tax=Hypomesus transpacificus TaxID=137520 RepID=UPI001F08293F|nr:surfactant protein Bb [Hypomesus transpacificus]